MFAGLPEPLQWGLAWTIAFGGAILRVILEVISFGVLKLNLVDGRWTLLGP